MDAAVGQELLQKRFMKYLYKNVLYSIDIKLFLWKVEGEFNFVRFYQTKEKHSTRKKIALFDSSESNRFNLQCNKIEAFSFMHFSCTYYTGFIFKKALFKATPQ